jgi:hypothetical protein
MEPSRPLFSAMVSRRRATFYTTGMEHSPTSATGTAWEPTPWRAMQDAAWEALDRAHSP